MTDLVGEFKLESLTLIDQMVELLESCETGNGSPDSLETFGQLADRMMGAARQLVRFTVGGHNDLTTVAEFTQLCKLLGYKSSQLDPAGGLWPVAIGVLLDATIELKTRVQALEQNVSGKATLVERAMIDRLEWLNKQFDERVDGNVPMSSGRIVDPNHLDALFNKLKGES